MDYLRQAWQDSGAFRATVVIAGIGLVLVLVTASRNELPQPSSPVPPSFGGVLDDIQDRLPGGNKTASGKIGDAAGKVADVAGKTVDAAGKVIDRVADRVGGTPQQGEGQRKP